MSRIFRLSLVLVPIIILFSWKRLIPKHYYSAKIGDMTEFLQNHNYPIESHEVTTEDGYILTMHRIPSGRNDDDKSRRPQTKPAILLMHGLTLSSVDWVVLGPEKAIGLILADAGYDVWLGNNRGNTYSRKHINVDPDRQKARFFNYSYHEIGIYDLPAMIDYIQQYTGHEKISYIGFSQGVTSFLVMASLRPEYNEKILLMNAFAPATDLHNTSTIPFNILAKFPIIMKVAQSLNLVEHLNIHISPLFRIGCQNRIICNFVFRILGSSDEKMPDQEFQLKVLSNNPAGISLKQLQHYTQGIITGIFAPYNENPHAVTVNDAYDLTKVTVPIIIYYGESDIYHNVHNILNVLANQLPNVIKVFKVPYPNFNHMDFIWGRDITLLTDEAITNINEFNIK